MSFAKNIQLNLPVSFPRFIQYSSEVPTFQLYRKPCPNHCSTIFIPVKSSSLFCFLNLRTGNLHSCFLWLLVTSLPFERNPFLKNVRLSGHPWLLLPVGLHLRFLITLSVCVFAGSPKADSHDLDKGIDCNLRIFEDNAKLEVVVGTPAGRAAIWVDLSKLVECAERNHMKFSPGKCKSCPSLVQSKPLHQHRLGTSRGVTLPKKTWCAKLNMSQSYALVARKDMKMAKYWNQSLREDVKFQFWQIIKTRLCKNLSNLR